MKHSSVLLAALPCIYAHLPQMMGMDMGMPGMAMEVECEDALHTVVYEFPAFFSTVYESASTIFNFMGGTNSLVINNPPQTIVTSTVLTTTIYSTATTTATTTVTSNPLVSVSATLGAGIPSGTVTNVPSSSPFALAYLVDALSASDQPAGFSSSNGSSTDPADAQFWYIQDGQLCSTNGGVVGRNFSDNWATIIPSFDTNDVTMTITLVDGMLQWDSPDAGSATFYNCDGILYAGFPDGPSNSCTQITVGAVAKYIVDAILAEGPSSSSTSDAVSSDAPSEASTTMSTSGSAMSTDSSTGASDAPTISDSATNSGSNGSTASTSSPSNAVTTSAATSNGGSGQISTAASGSSNQMTSNAGSSGNGQGSSTQGSSVQVISTTGTGSSTQGTTTSTGANGATTVAGSSGASSAVTGTQATSMTSSSTSASATSSSSGYICPGTANGTIVGDFHVYCGQVVDPVSDANTILPARSDIASFSGCLSLCDTTANCTGASYFESSTTCYIHTGTNKSPQAKPGWDGAIKVGYEPGSGASTSSSATSSSSSSSSSSTASGSTIATGSTSSGSSSPASGSTSTSSTSMSTTSMSPLNSSSTAMTSVNLPNTSLNITAPNTAITATNSGTTKPSTGTNSTGTTSTGSPNTGATGAGTTNAGTTNNGTTGTGTTNTGTTGTGSTSTSSPSPMFSDPACNTGNGTIAPDGTQYKVFCGKALTTSGTINVTPTLETSNLTACVQACDNAMTNYNMNCISVSWVAGTGPHFCYMHYGSDQSFNNNTGYHSAIRNDPSNANDPCLSGTC